MDNTLQLWFTSSFLFLLGIVFSPVNGLQLLNVSSLNCSWEYFKQPISHFDTPTYHFTQRVCIVDTFFRRPAPDFGRRFRKVTGTNDEDGDNQGPFPIFFYTGNEGPVELYVNNTGLMWEAAPEFGALLVFAEHRYFGESIPDLKGKANCLSYLTSTQALADYVMLLSQIREKWGLQDKEKYPTIAFGGSYGGMLAAWMRITYPNVVKGAIAASAPIWGFPDNGPPPDGANVVISNNLPSENCKNNFRASWVLLRMLSTSSAGRKLISNRLKLCDPVGGPEDMNVIISVLQDVFFLLSESNYPFPSDYIVFSILGVRKALPPWPMSKACSMVDKDYLVKVTGDVKEVNFSVDVLYNSTNINRISVDWDKINSKDSNFSITDFMTYGQRTSELLADVFNVYNMFYNITGGLKCLDWRENAQEKINIPTLHRRYTNEKESLKKPWLIIRNNTSLDPESNDICSVNKQDLDPLTAWGGLVCNEGMVLVQDILRGVGNDIFWPPNVHDRDYSVAHLEASLLDYCDTYQHMGLSGTPQAEYRDPFGKWLSLKYGAKEIVNYASNIVFSNGAYDPWNPAGVLPVHGRANGQVLPILIPLGAHHTDLFFETRYDDDELKRIRDDEKIAIWSWISGDIKPISSPTLTPTVTPTTPPSLYPDRCPKKSFVDVFLLGFVVALLGLFGYSFYKYHTYKEKMPQQIARNEANRNNRLRPDPYAYHVIDPL